MEAQKAPQPLDVEKYPEAGIRRSRHYLLWCFVLLVLGLIAFQLYRLSRNSAAIPASDWHERLDEAMPLMGHRNWIMVVDSAYPLQSEPGVETLETDATEQEVVEEVLKTVRASIHVRPLIFMDSELPYVPDADAPGASAYRREIQSILSGLPVTMKPHDEIIQDVAETAKTFHVLVLKTKLAIPYTSVFIRLDCKYWSADAEKRLREQMTAGKP